MRRMVVDIEMEEEGGLGRKRWKVETFYNNSASIFHWRNGFAAAS
jgi:hypothetical protein